MSIGDRVRAAREHVNLNQPEFAERLGIKQSQLSYIENDKRKPNDKMLVAMYVNFKINSDWIITGIGQIIDGVDVAMPTPTKRTIDDSDIMLMIIQAIEEYVYSKNLHIAPEVKARLIFSFYDYFCNADKLTLQDVKNSVVQSADLLLNSIRRSK